MPMDVNNKLQLKQGVRSNTKGVQKELREHILSRYSPEALGEVEEGYTPVGGLKADVEAASNPSDPNGAKNIVQGGNFHIYYDDVRNFIESLGLRKSKPEYNDDETWNLYVNLMAREIKNLINNPKLADKLLKPIVPAPKQEAQPAPAPAPMVKPEVK
jgi:hypothetical protein